MVLGSYISSHQIFPFVPDLWYAIISSFHSSLPSRSHQGVWIIWCRFDLAFTTFTPTVDKHWMEQWCSIQNVWSNFTFLWDLSLFINCLQLNLLLVVTHNNLSLRCCIEAFIKQALQYTHVQLGRIPWYYVELIKLDCQQAPEQVTGYLVYPSHAHKNNLVITTSTFSSSLSVSGALALVVYSQIF